MASTKFFAWLPLANVKASAYRKGKQSMNECMDGGHLMSARGTLLLYTEQFNDECVDNELFHSTSPNEFAEGKFHWL